MDYQKAVTVLQRVLERRPLDAEEKEAVQKAIGMLSIASRATSRLKDLKAKREKSTEW
jgi:hypothetical protein